MPLDIGIFSPSLRVKLQLTVSLFQKEMDFPLGKR